MERLLINIYKPSGCEGDRGRDFGRWLQLLGAFRSVKDLYLVCRRWDWGPVLYMQRALEESTDREGIDPGGIAGATHPPNERKSTSLTDQLGLSRRLRMRAGTLVDPS